MDRMLLTVFLISLAQTQAMKLIVPDRPIRAAVGENAVLLCHLEPPTDLEQDLVEWSFNDQTVWLYRNKKENPTDQAKEFSNRVTFSGNMNSGNISVTLQSVTKTDEGNHTCHVDRDSKSYRAIITLLVEEKCEDDWTIGVQQNPNIKPIVPDQPIRAAVGENAVLLCHLEPPTDLEQDMVEWSFNDQTVWLYRNQKENPTDQAKEFSKRVTFSGNKKSGNISVTLQSVTKTDEGNYTCHVERGGKSFRAIITLLVEEKSEKKEQNNKNITPLGNPNMKLIVPDQPIRADVGENAVLLCHLEPPTDLEQDMVEWRFNDQTVWVYRNKKENTMDQAKEFSKRVTFSGNKKSGNISVTLQSVTKTDEGDYTCHVERGGKSYRAIITLLVEEKSEKKEQNNKNITPLGNPTDNVEPTKSAGADDGAGFGFGVVIAVVVVAVAVVGAVAIYTKWKKPKCRGSETGTQTEAETASLPPQPEAAVIRGPASQSLKNRKSSPLKPQLKTRARENLQHKLRDSVGSFKQNTCKC